VIKTIQPLITSILNQVSGPSFLPNTIRDGHLPTIGFLDALHSLISDLCCSSDQERPPITPRSVNDVPLGILSVHFTGRDKEVDFLKDALSKVEGDKPCCCAVHGMPGVGKSQLVLHLAKVSFDQGRYSYIFWISGTSVDKLNHGLTHVLDLVGYPHHHLQEQSAKLTAARRWLEECHDNWLLILDNVDQSILDSLRTYLPRRSSRGNILFTTRRADMAETLATMAGNHQSTLSLRSMELRDSANLLLKDAGFDMGIVSPALLSHAEELVECVGRLPLAVVQAGSCMKQTQMNIDEMLELYMSAQKIEVSSYAFRYIIRCMYLNPLAPTGNSMGK
jgi:hypothetical protein